jgi:hypothetical protein
MTDGDDPIIWHRSFPRCERIPVKQGPEMTSIVRREQQPMGTGQWLYVAVGCATVAVTCGVAAVLLSQRAVAWRRWNRTMVVVHELDAAALSSLVSFPFPARL